MNNTNVTEFFIEVLREVKTGVETQLPQVAQQALAYDLIAAWIWTGASVIIALILAALTLWVMFNSDDGEFATLFLSIPFFVVLAIGVSNVTDIVKIKVAPKLYLVERFTKMVKGE